MNEEKDHKASRHRSSAMAVKTGARRSAPVAGRKESVRATLGSKNSTTKTSTAHTGAAKKLLDKPSVKPAGKLRFSEERSETASMSTAKSRAKQAPPKAAATVPRSATAPKSSSRTTDAASARKRVAAVTPETSPATVTAGTKGRAAGRVAKSAGSKKADGRKIAASPIAKSNTAHATDSVARPAANRNTRSGPIAGTPTRGIGDRLAPTKAPTTTRNKASGKVSRPSSPLAQTTKTLRMGQRTGASARASLDRHPNEKPGQDIDRES